MCLLCKCKVCCYHFDLEIVKEADGEVGSRLREWRGGSGLKQIASHADSALYRCEKLRRTQRCQAVLVDAYKCWQRRGATPPIEPVQPGASQEAAAD